MTVTCHRPARAGRTYCSGRMPSRPRSVFVWYLPLIKQNQRFRRDLLVLETKIQEQERLGRHLRLSIDSVQNDPRTIERLAREKLGLARTNETVIRFEGPKR